MAASPSTVLTRGLGSWGSVNLLLTRGLGSAEAAESHGFLCVGRVTIRPALTARLTNQPALTTSAELEPALTANVEISQCP